MRSGGKTFTSIYNLGGVEGNRGRGISRYYRFLKILNVKFDPIIVREFIEGNKATFPQLIHNYIFVTFSGKQSSNISSFDRFAIVLIS